LLLAFFFAFAFCPRCIDVSSNALLVWATQFFEQDRVDYDQHEAVFLQISPRTNVLMGAFVWKTKRGQAAGGIRLREVSHAACISCRPSRNDTDALG
jgi:hypothetical protein